MIQAFAQLEIRQFERKDDAGEMVVAVKGSRDWSLTSDGKCRGWAEVVFTTRQSTAIQNSSFTQDTYNSRYHLCVCQYYKILKMYHSVLRSLDWLIFLPSHLVN